MEIPFAVTLAAPCDEHHHNGRAYINYCRQQRQLGTVPGLVFRVSCTVEAYTGFSSAIVTKVLAKVLVWRLDVLRLGIRDFRAF